MSFSSMSHKKAYVSIDCGHEEADMATDSMNLKVRELLKEVQLHHSPAITKIVDDVVSSIKEAIDKIPDDLQVTADVAPGFVRDIGADKVEFKFKKPKSIEIGGSYSLGCMVKPDVNIDVFIQLPKGCFLEKDYLNYRYHAKRCLYLSIIKKYLKSSSLAQKVEWSTFQNEARKPILLFYPAIKLAETSGWYLRLIPTATSLFSFSKLNMQRNNIRALNQGALDATPVYNSSILEDMLLEDNMKLINSIFLGWKELGEALILLKVWARQRSSIYAHDCLNGYLISIIMAYLATDSPAKCINKSMNTVQIFRTTLDFIATSKSWKNGIFFKHQGAINISKAEGNIYLRSFPAVVCDPFGHFNMAFRMSKNGLLELQGEASSALSCLNKCRDGGFDEIFITRIDLAAKFDHCIRLNLKGNAEIYASGFCSDNECWRSCELKLHSLLHEGLGNRVKFVRVIWRNTASGCNVEEGLSMFDREALVIGISLNSEEAFRQVVKGPSNENRDEVLKFRKFWGAKTGYRKVEHVNIWCAVWKCEPWGAHLIIKWITEHILVTHLSLSKENIRHIVDQLDFTLVQGYGDPTSSAGHLLKAFHKLSSCLRQLNDIPLKISSVQPLDSALRFTSVCPPQPHPLASEDNIDEGMKKFISTCIQPVEVMIQLEGSGTWPMDDVALEKTKSAFILHIAKSLQKNWNMRVTATEENVNVLFSGYAFRLKILHERGLGLLNRHQARSNQSKRISSTDRKLLLQSQHSNMISGLRGQYSIYEPVVRLAKRWIAAHLFSATLAEEAIELLVAHLFLEPLPFSAPCSRITGFLRFLRLLSEHDWTFYPLIVDMNGDLTLDDKEEINENFKLSRNTYEQETKSVSSAMFLATAYDKDSGAWTKSSPSSLDLKRLAAYARSSSNLLTRLILQDQLDSYGWECIFRTPLNNYDAVILLHRDLLPYPERLLFPSELNQGRLVVRGKPSKLFHPFMLPGDTKANNIEEFERKLMVDFDPLRCFIDDLERRFPDMFKVWYDSLGGDAIGLTWEKEGLKKRGRDVGEEEKILLDELKAVGDVGKGFVRSIYSLKVPRLN